MYSIKKILTVKRTSFHYFFNLTIVSLMLVSSIVIVPAYASPLQNESLKPVQNQQVQTVDTPTCVSFNSFSPGEPVEGFGTVHPALNITTSTGKAVAIANDEIPFAYAAPNTPDDLRRGNGGIPDDNGFYDEERSHDYNFTFNLGQTVDLFSINILDYGDFNQNGGTEHEVRLTAYDISGNVVGTESLEFTSDANTIPRSGSAGDLWFTGDAVSSQPGQPGNYTFTIEGQNIAFLELRASSNVDPDGPSDPYFALTNLCFQLENNPTPPSTTCVDFNTVAVGESVEGMGTIFPGFNITTSTGKAVAIQESEIPYAYAAPNTPAELRRGNGGVTNFNGFYDEDRVHEYDFAFDLGTTVDFFALNMLDYGDFNRNGGTEHEVRLTAYDIGGNIVDTDILSFTSDAGTIPRSGSAGDLWYTGDAVSSQPGQPGNYTFIVEGQNIAYLELRGSSNVDPSIPSDPYFALSVLCFNPEKTPPPVNNTCVDFNTILPGDSVEGLGTVHPDLNISTSTGQAVAVTESELPYAYAAPNTPDELRRGNGNMLNFTGFYDTDRIHEYDFSFAPGKTVNQFSINMYDYGDFNQYNATEHEVRLTAYDINGNVIDADVLSYTSDAGTIPHSGSAGDLWFTGDAVSSRPGQPGNYTFNIEGQGIARVEFRASSNTNPDARSDPYFSLAVLCFSPENPPEPPPNLTCANFDAIVPGSSVEGLGTVQANLNISSSTNQSVAVTESELPFAYAAPNEPASLRRGNGGMIDFSGFYDGDRIHEYDFSFAPGQAVNYFTLDMLDYGDFNQYNATEHEIRLIAYDINDNIVASELLSFTSDAGTIPHSGSAGDLWLTGDAVSSEGKQPGTHTFTIRGDGIARVEFRASSNTNPGVRGDPYFSLSNLCFAPETPPPPSDTPESCEDLGYTTIAEDSWDEHVIDGMNPITLGYARPSAADYAIVNTGWEWTGNPDQHQVTEMHSVETPFGTVTSQDYGDHELAGQVLWFGAPQGDFTQPSLQVTIDYAGDGSDPGSHRSHGLIAWCDNPDIEPPQNEPLTCEDIGLEAVSTAEWSTHVIRGMTPVTENFTQPADANYVIVNTAWAWSGTPDQHQYDEKHSVTTPLGTAVSDDYGDAELEGELIWYDALQGAFGAGSLDATIDFAGDGSDPGSHISKGMVNWCFDPAAPDASTTLLQPMTDDGAQVEVAFACTDAAPNLVSAGLNDYTVENGQVLWLVPSEDSFSNTLDGGLTAIYGPAFSLAVTCADADGNQSTTIITPDLGGG